MSEANPIAQAETPTARVLEHSDQRAAQIVRERFGSRIRFNTDRQAWMVYEAGHWQHDAAGRVQEFIKRIAAETVSRLKKKTKLDPRQIEKIALHFQSSRGVSSVRRLLSSEPGVAVASSQLDRHPFLLNVANGTVDLRSGELGPHRPDDLLTKMIPVAFNRDATCPIFDAHRATVFSAHPELSNYLQRCAGLWASGDASVQELHIPYGSGANGKSVTMDAILHVLGDYACTAPDSLMIARTYGTEHPTELAGLHGKRLVVASETEDGAQLRTQLIKRMTGDAQLRARFMRGDFFDFQRTFKLVLVTNNKPKINEDTEGVWRRIRLIPFTTTIPLEQRDQGLLDKLRAEAAGILVWMVRGSVTRLRDGMLPPACVLSATAEYRTESDTFGDFLDSELIIHDLPGVVRMTRQQLCLAYRSWCKRTGEMSPMPDRSLYERIRNVKGVADGEWKNEGVKVRGFDGVDFRSKHPALLKQGELPF